MNQFDVKVKREVNGNTFYVRPFSAFTSVNLSGEVMSLILPIIGSIIPTVSGGKSELMDVDLDAAMPALANGMSAISGDKIEALMKKLLVKYGNISVRADKEKEAQMLTEDIANEIFCGNAQDMFTLAVDVIRANYDGFFKKLGGQYGELLDNLLQKAQPGLENTGNLT